ASTSTCRPVWHLWSRSGREWWPVKPFWPIFAHRRGRARARSARSRDPAERFAKGFGKVFHVLFPCHGKGGGATGGTPIQHAGTRKALERHTDMRRRPAARLRDQSIN